MDTSPLDQTVATLNFGATTSTAQPSRAGKNPPGQSSIRPPFGEEHPDWIVSFDGAMEPAGKSTVRGAWGFVVQDATGREHHRASSLMPVGGCASNNVAEYTALLEAIAWCKANLPQDAAILWQGDSQLVVHHVRGVWGWNAKKTRCNPHKKHPHLLPFLQQAVAELEEFRPLESPFVSEPGPHEKANALPIRRVPATENPADSVSRAPYDAAGIVSEKRGRALLAEGEAPPEPIFLKFW